MGNSNIPSSKTIKDNNDINAVNKKFDKSDTPSPKDTNELISDSIRKNILDEKATNYVNETNNKNIKDQIQNLTNVTKIKVKDSKVNDTLLSCEYCDYKAFNNVGLNVHNTLMHVKELP